MGRGRGKKIVAALATFLVLVAGGLFAGWYFFIRSEAEPPAEIEETRVREGGALDGTYTLEAGDPESFVGYRVLEVLAGIDNTATGRTSDVEGSFSITDTTVSEVSVTADLSTLKSDRYRRDQRIKTLGLESEQFPEATFVLTEPIELAAIPKAGKTVTANAVGDFTLHGVTRSVEIDLEGRWDGRDIQVVGNLPITFGDYGMETPSIAGLVTVRDDGAMELQLFFRKS